MSSLRTIARISPDAIALEVNFIVETSPECIIQVASIYEIGLYIPKRNALSAASAHMITTAIHLRITVPNI